MGFACHSQQYWKMHIDLWVFNTVFKPVSASGKRRQIIDWGREVFRAAPRLWTSLRETVQLSNSLGIIKNSLKTHLHKEAFCKVHFLLEIVKLCDATFISCCFLFYDAAPWAPLAADTNAFKVSINIIIHTESIVTIRWTKPIPWSIITHHISTQKVMMFAGIINDGLLHFVFHFYRPLTRLLFTVLLKLLPKKKEKKKKTQI